MHRPRSRSPTFPPASDCKCKLPFVLLAVRVRRQGKGKGAQGAEGRGSTLSRVGTQIPTHPTASQPRSHAHTAGSCQAKPKRQGSA